MFFSSRISMEQNKSTNNIIRPIAIYSNGVIPGLRTSTFNGVIPGLRTSTSNGFMRKNGTSTSNLPNVALQTNETSTSNGVMQTNGIYNSNLLNVAMQTNGTSTSNGFMQTNGIYNSNLLNVAMQKNGTSTSNGVITGLRTSTFNLLNGYMQTKGTSTFNGVIPGLILNTNNLINYNFNFNIYSKPESFITMKKSPTQQQIKEEKFLSNNYKNEEIFQHPFYNYEERLKDSKDNVEKVHDKEQKEIIKKIFSTQWGNLVNENKNIFLTMISCLLFKNKKYITKLNIEKKINKNKKIKEIIENIYNKYYKHESIKKLCIVFLDFMIHCENHKKNYCVFLWSNHLNLTKEEIQIFKDIINLLPFQHKKKDYLFQKCKLSTLKKIIKTNNLFIR